VSIALLVIVIVTAVLITYQWTQTRFYVGADEDSVVIFQGIQQDIGPISLHSVYEDTGIPLDQLTAYDRQAIEATISVPSLEAARSITERLEQTSGQ
ncbi:MAG: serine/threonine-protein phosphatase, partial [Microterricola sp.]